MSAQALGAKALRRIAADVGVPIRRAWSHGGYTFEFVTHDHVHGAWSKKTREWEFHEPAEVMHYAPACQVMFSGPFPADACGASATITSPADGETVLMWCELDPHESGRHRCGSESWDPA